MTESNDISLTFPKHFMMIFISYRFIYICIYFYYFSRSLNSNPFKNPDKEMAERLGEVDKNDGSIKPNFQYYFVLTACLVKKDDKLRTPKRTGGFRVCG